MKMESSCTIYIDDGTPFAPETILSRLVWAGEATLTTEHSASSYGQPVLVLADGSVLGAGDVPDAWHIAAEDKELSSRFLDLRFPAAVL